jgi:hypothetical protein
MEHFHQKPLSSSAFRRRFIKYLLAAFSLILVSLGIGMAGYHAFESMSWIDAFVNASMILSGMGPMGELKTESGKFFAGCYALFSGIIFLAITGLIFSPLLHRLMHKFHFKDKLPGDR